jgi:hypothetical protein
MTKRLIMALALAALILPDTGYADFDRDQCYGKCRGLPLRMGQIPEEMRLSHLAQGNYDGCIQECDRRFWAEFDQTTKSEKDEKDW